MTGWSSSSSFTCKHEQQKQIRHADCTSTEAKRRYSTVRLVLGTVFQDRPLCARHQSLECSAHLDTMAAWP